MKTTSQVADHLRQALLHPAGGVVGLLDGLLFECHKYRLQLVCQADCCRFRFPDGEWEDLNDMSLGRSVFRAILARLASLCNEQVPNSVSPYAGQAQLIVGRNPSSLIRVRFSNTPANQMLELTTEADHETLTHSES